MCKLDVWRVESQPVTGKRDGVLCDNVTVFCVVACCVVLA